MKITRLRVRNYRGIEALDQLVPPGGMMVKGRNGGGKTSLLNAVRAALAGQDIAPDAIRIGHDRAEILVDMTDVSVRRVITEKTSTLTVEGPKGKVASPQKWLNELLGIAALDPIELFNDKPKDRTKRILAAIPIRISAADLAGHEGLEAGDVNAVDLTQHGLVVCQQLAKVVYDRRTGVNAQVKDAQAWLDSNPGRPEPAAKPFEEADAARNAAGEALRELQQRAAVEAGQKQVRDKQREKLAKAREDAQAAGNLDELNASIGALRIEQKSVLEQVENLRAELAKAEEVARAVQTTLREQEVKLSRLHDALGNIETLQQELDADDSQGVSETDLAAANAAFEAATRDLELAKELRHVRIMNENRSEKEHVWRKLTQHAGKLTGTLDILREALPARLIKESNAIPGLSFDGEEVLMDGVRLDGLSGREQLLFAVEIARRLNAKSKILVVDKLEAVDAEQLDDFVKAATADGFQLLGTRVDAGDVVLEALSPDDPE